jgi:hypothetical protein
MNTVIKARRGCTECQMGRDQPAGRQGTRDEGQGTRDELAGWVGTLAHLPAGRQVGKLANY